MAVILVEHMEEYPTRWLVAEYIEAGREAAMAGLELIVTGVRDPRLQALLSKHGIPWTWEHSWDLYDNPKAIVLDLWAEKDLEPSEAQVAEAFVIGGIMGDHPPKMRGYLLSSQFDWASKRRLGPKQMSIHVTAWAVGQVRRGVRVGELNLCDRAVVRINAGFFETEIELPFAYPCDGEGRPRVPDRIVRLLENGVLWDEEVNLA
ncbi:MAG: hypothetical protein F7B19_03650 [Desulfurococcales archaeon]|nr:hypothetical protein [Desulfurococcales archaeon]